MKQTHEGAERGSVPAIIVIEDLVKDFGPLRVLNQVSLSISEGERVAIIGPSGSGKSTLLRCINGLEAKTSGRIVLDGMEVGDPDVPLAKIRTEASMVFQQFNLFPHKTVLQNITLAPIRVRKMPKADASARAMELLTRVGLPEKADSYPGSLSGGQQQRVAIARALAMQPKVILFDEPTSALDPELTVEVLDVMRDLARTTNTTLVIVTHEMAFAQEVADVVVMLDQGVIIEMGRPDEVFGNPSTERGRAFLGRMLNQHHGEQE